MSLPRIIGITGKKFSGKDTLAKYFIDKYGYKRIAFADVLKDICKTIFNFSDDQLYGNKKEEEDIYWKITPRKVLQFIGTELFRNQIGNILPLIGDKIWIESVRKQILLNENQKYIITDIRFQNELDMVTELGGMTMKIRRDNLVYDTHDSEINISTFIVDHEIENNNTIEELHEKINVFFNSA
jgi:hypothetical protein